MSPGCWQNWNKRAQSDWNQGPGDLQSAALATEWFTQWNSSHKFSTCENLCRKHCSIERRKEIDKYSNITIKYSWQPNAGMYNLHDTIIDQPQDNSTMQPLENLYGKTNFLLRNFLFDSSQYNQETCKKWSWHCFFLNFVTYLMWSLEETCILYITWFWRDPDFHSICCIHSTLRNSCQYLAISFSVRSVLHIASMEKMILK